MSVSCHYHRHRITEGERCCPFSSNGQDLFRPRTHCQLLSDPWAFIKLKPSTITAYPWPRAQGSKDRLSAPPFRLTGRPVQLAKIRGYDNWAKESSKCRCVMCSMHGFSDLFFIQIYFTDRRVCAWKHHVGLSQNSVPWNPVVNHHFPIEPPFGGQTNPWPVFPVIDGKQSWSSSQKVWKNRRANQQSFTKKLRSTLQEISSGRHIIKWHSVTTLLFLFLFKKFCTVCDKGL